MTYSVVIMASAAAGEGASEGLFGSLGIDWKMLVLQAVAFLLLLFLLSKYVYPLLVQAIDKREKAIADSLEAAHAAETSAAEANEKTARLMKQARKDADEVVASARAEAAQLVAAAEKKSRERAEQIDADAKAEIAKNLAAAKQSLRAETLGLVAEATEKVVGKTVNVSVDKKIVAAAVEEVKA